MSESPLPVNTTALTKQQARALERPDFVLYLSQADLSDARRYFQLARYTTRQHDKVELVAGAIVGILLGWLLGGGTWFGSLVAGVLALFATLVLIFLIHWIRSPSAFHKAAVLDGLVKAKELEAEQNKNNRKAFVIEQIKDLISEAKSLDTYHDADENIHTAVYNMGRQIEHVGRVEELLKRYIESADLERYREGNAMFRASQTRSVLESLLQRVVEDEIGLKPPSLVTKMDQPHHQ